MPRLKSANNASTTLNGSLAINTTSFSVFNASLFPAAPFRITVDAEIMEVGTNDIVGNTFSSVVRGVEGTTAATHSTGATVENRLTSGTYNELAVDQDVLNIRVRSFMGVF